MTCAVLRCSEPFAHTEVIQEKPIRTEVSFCADHWAQAEAGASWVAEWQHQAQKRVVLMGEDLPLRYVQNGIRDDVMTPDHVVVTLTLKRWDDSDKIVKFVLPRDKAAEFTSLSRVGGGPPKGNVQDGDEEL